MSSFESALKGTRVIEMVGIGPVPFCTMLLADLGAEVVRIERPSTGASARDTDPKFDLMTRNKRTSHIDLKANGGLESFLDLLATGDVLVEGFRPGVMEKLGIGPDVCLRRHPRLVYARMTGWGQTGPLSHAAGHDLNYLALSGALGAIGPKDGPPAIPLNLVADFGGGALYLAMGILAALLKARSDGGRGSVIDAAMVDGAASLMTPFFGQMQEGRWTDERGSNLLDGGAPFYNIYETADAQFVTIAALEPKFYAEFLRLTGLDGEHLPSQMDREGWPLLKQRFERLFRKHTRAEWCDRLEGTDACFAPVLTMRESMVHPHNVARATFSTDGTVTRPAPAPRVTPGPERVPDENCSR